jgi:SAM-dependent methyltransferase
VSADELQRQHEWLELGAIEKARSVIELARGLSVSSVLEVGAGTGAVLAALDRLGFGEAYYAVEPSPAMLAHLTERAQVGRLADARAATLRDSGFLDRHFDLAILSHVLEHVRDPAVLLSETLRVADHVLLEVPLEGSLGGNLRWRMRHRVTSAPRTQNAAGHIQFFSRGDVRKLVTWCGGRVERERLHLPRPQMRDAMTSGSITKRFYAQMVWAGSRTIGERPWAVTYYGHFAVLARRDCTGGPEDDHRHAFYFKNNVDNAD